MSGRLRTLGIVVGVFVVIALGFFFLRGPTPHIEIKAETLWKVGPLDVTNTLFTTWIVIIIISVGAFLSTRKLSVIPGRWQSFVEAAIEALFELVHNTVGDYQARRFFPVIATIFIFIVIANWFALFPFFSVIGKFERIGAEEEEFFQQAVVFEEGAGFSLILPDATELDFEDVDEAACEGTEGHEREECLDALRENEIARVLTEEGVEDQESVGIIAPYFRSVNTDLMTPLALAIVSAIFVEYWGISALGFLAYASRFVNFKRLMRGDPMGIIDAFVGLLEFIAEIARLISFSFRLFGNMLAGEILLLVMTFLVPLVLALPFYGLELFVGAIQAFVFAMLTLVFGALAVTGHDDGHEETTKPEPAEEAAPAQQGA